MTSDDHLWLRYEMMLGFASARHSFAAFRPEPGSLPEPLERAANEVYDSKTANEAKAAAHKFLILSEEWADRGA